MNSSQNTKLPLLPTLFRDSRTVFRLSDIAMLTGETRLASLNKQLNYYVKKGEIGNPRKGIYTKKPFKIGELACILYTPSYLSLEWVLASQGLIFQFSSEITLVSYLSRQITIGGTQLRYRAVKSTILVNTSGIIRDKSNLNISSPERAFLDMLYLQPDFYFDTIESLNNSKVRQLIPLYQSHALRRRALNWIGDD
ncbi:MAG: hypothetical protein IH596_11130 [Bacteroidales bacterium]|nr:hypothetical protein [Bacteroidales bacterium]